MRVLSRVFLLLLVGLVVFSAYAQAQTPAPLVLNPSGSTTLSDLLNRPLSFQNSTFNGGKAVDIKAQVAGLIAGKPIPIEGKVPVKAINAAKAVAKAAGKVVLPLSVASALHDAYCELTPDGIMCDPGQPMTPQDAWCLSQHVASACFQYPNTAVQNAFNQWRATIANKHRIVSGPTTEYVSPSQQNGRATIQFQDNQGNDLGGPTHWQTSVYKRVAPLCPENTEIIPEDSEVPSCTTTGPKENFSNNEPVLTKRVLPALDQDLPGTVKSVIDSGEDIAPFSEPASLTGPAKTVGEPQVTKTTKPDGTEEVKTVTPTYNHTYNNTTITTNITYTTVYGDGTVVEEEQPEDHTPPAVDPDMPPLPTLYEPKYPDGMAGVWADKGQQLRDTGLFAFLGSLVPTIGGGGCPVWQLPVMHGIGLTSVADISVPCWVWQAIRVLMLVMAAILCRRLIFGG